VDVGSNDGSLLQHFKAAGFNVMGVEPTAAAMEAQCKGIPTCPTTLRTDLVRWWLKDLGKPEKAQVITACNVFAHTPDPNGFVATVKEFLADDGVFVVEVQNVFSLEYDTVYHEHLQYYSLESLNRLFHRNEMEIIRYRSIPTHGGSLRVYVTKSTSDKCRVPTLGIPADDFSGKVFGKQVVRQRLELLALIAELKRSGAKIYGVGCPSRGVSLIYFAGLQGVLDCVCEIAGSPKIGHYVPACKIPIVDERFLYEVQPRYALLLSWHLADDLIQKIRAKGFKGQFILPLPNARVV
jgi:SAM-dependent methyltransferase